MENKREWDGYFNYEFDVQSVNNGIDVMQFNNNYFENKKFNGNIFTFKKDEWSNNKIKSKSIHDFHRKVCIIPHHFCLV